MNDGLSGARVHAVAQASRDLRDLKAAVPTATWRVPDLAA
jgi:hypothetical protein